MFKKLYLLLALILTVCATFLISCESEELDHSHEFIINDIPPTCTAVGKKEQYCKICGYTEHIETVAAKGHDLHDWQTKVEPTCTVNRVDERICKTCNVVVETKVFELTGHKYGEMQLVQSATCTEMGLMAQICQVCGATGPTQMTEKKQHNYTPIEVGSTCVVGSHTRYTCTSCGDSYGEGYEKPIATHEESDSWVIVIAPTCNASGIQKKICSICASDIRYEEIPVNMDNHSFKVETIPPAENSEGYVLYTCKNCGFEKKSIYETNYLPSQIYEMIASATVRVESYGKGGKLNNVGSGFFITENGEILTNFHVIAGAHSIKVRLFGGDEYVVAGIKGYDIALDLAVLKIDKAGTSFLKVATSDAKTGDAVYTLGSPLGIDSIFTSGIVSNPIKNINGVNCIVFTAPVSQGNSGGPLVNSRGEVIGINKSVADNAQNLNFAATIKLLDDIDTETEKTVEDVYAETLKVNALSVLKKYISSNYVKKDENGRLVIDRVVRQESDDGSVGGWSYELAYDEKTGKVILSFIWIQNGVNLYRADVLLDSVKDSYDVEFYDYIWAQHTMKGVVNVNITPIKNESGRLDASVSGGILKFSYVAYKPQATSNTLGYYTARELFGMAYLNILDQTRIILEESETGLTMEHFNFREVTEKAEEAEPNV